MMQVRDWIAGGVGVVIGGIGLLSLLGLLPFELSRSVLIGIVAIAGIYVGYTAIVEITNSNVMGKIAGGFALVALVISVLPILNMFGVFGSWASFSWLGDVVYKFVLIGEGALLVIATFAMEL